MSDEKRTLEILRCIRGMTCGAEDKTAMVMAAAITYIDRQKPNTARQMLLHCIKALECMEATQAHDKAAI